MKIFRWDFFKNLPTTENWEEQFSRLLFIKMKMLIISGTYSTNYPCVRESCWPRGPICERVQKWLESSKNKKTRRSHQRMITWREMVKSEVKYQNTLFTLSLIVRVNSKSNFIFVPHLLCGAFSLTLIFAPSNLYMKLTDISHSLLWPTTRHKMHTSKSYVATNT